RGLRLDDIGRLPSGNAWLFVEFGADTVERASALAMELMGSLERGPDCPNSMLVEDAELQGRFWSIRETGASATALSLEEGKPDPVVGWEDAAVDPLRLGDYLREFQSLVDGYGYETSLYGHFGDGCIHARINFDLRSAEGIGKWREFLKKAAELVVKYGGSLSGEHGDGQAKAEFLPIMYGEELMQAFREFKSIWDPLNRMNPGKLVDAYRVDENLRMGPDYRPREFPVHFSYASARGSFSRAIERCIGMGKCRSTEGGTMCPSYRATGDERHSTRGRSRLLFEMLRGEVIENGWKSEEVKEALDSCLSCKGCRSDCPTHVDMATYKAEFLSGYYENRPRPVQAYSMGMTNLWARLASLAPRLVNWVTASPVLHPMLKKMAGIDPRRRIPRLPMRTFRRMFVPKKPSEEGIGRVILWPDTFNNYFRPETALAAAVVLENAGYIVELPKRQLCCGRPLYDFGMLDQAKSQLREIMKDLRKEIEAGIPIVGLEPACVSTFRDELPNLFPHDEIAAKLSRQVFMFSEFLEKTDFMPPR
ncbi:MAG TPA: FAD-linked oxidase C-terminal domain-containing protein, partial [Burkholderiales bacterium]|nr:FAD-linked oxidase C-terminal domain-containing protein [Burkholderiales bacterium]